MRNTLSFSHGFFVSGKLAAIFLSLQNYCVCMIICYTSASYNVEYSLFISVHCYTNVAYARMIPRDLNFHHNVNLFTAPEDTSEGSQLPSPQETSSEEPNSKSRV